MEAKNWLVEFCLKCNLNVSQIPITEDNVGDDVNVRDAVKEYRDRQQSNDPFLCNCGNKLIPRYALGQPLENVRITA